MINSPQDEPTNFRNIFGVAGGVIGGVLGGVFGFGAGAVPGAAAGAGIGMGIGGLAGGVTDNANKPEPQFKLGQHSGLSAMDQHAAQSSGGALSDVYGAMDLLHKLPREFRGQYGNNLYQAHVIGTGDSPYPGASSYASPEAYGTGAGDFVGMGTEVA